MAAVLFLINSISFAEPESKNSASPPDRGYTYNLKELIDKAKENIRKVDKELEQRAVEERNMQIEAKAQEHFEKGNILYGQGKLREAKQEWQKALETTKNPELEEYIKSSEKKAREKKLSHQEEERDRQARIKQQQEKETAGPKKQGRQKEERSPLEKQRKEREAVEKELKKKLKADKKIGQNKKEEQKSGQNFNWQ